MRIAVVTCWKYRDAWTAFSKLFDTFWPDCPYKLEFITDTKEQPLPWCTVLANFASFVIATSKEPLLVMQEDLWLTAPVRTELIQRGLEQLEATNAGCVRLYPCPGGLEEYGDPHYAIVPRGTPYRVSCMPALWRSDYLYKIASRFNTPAEFELLGTPYSNELPDEVLAFKRDVQPWPLEILCSAISRGKWNPDAKKLCDKIGIEVNWSMRESQRT